MAQTIAQELAQFTARARFDVLKPVALDQLKIRILDSLGVSIGALKTPLLQKLKMQVEEFGGNGLCSLIGGGKTSPDRAAFFNGALVRYLDFMDSYVAPHETFHPSDHLSSVLAASEYADLNGKEFLTALAVSYEVAARLAQNAPVRPHGFDHTTLLSFSLAAGISKALKMDEERTAHAIGICGTTGPALRVTRTGNLSQWKGLAAPHAAFEAMHSTFLAHRGVTGPLEVFEGKFGFIQSISGPFSIRWNQDGFASLPHSFLKKYDAEVHAQSAIDALLEIRDQALPVEEIEWIEVHTFQVAKDIIGLDAGDLPAGRPLSIQTREEADHSFPYMIAVALLDGKLLPEQYLPERILRKDVQALLQKVRIRVDPFLSTRFPEEFPAIIRIQKRDGRLIHNEVSDYEGFTTHPMSWEVAIAKFKHLCASVQFPSGHLIQAVHNIEELQIRDLVSHFTPTFTSISQGVSMIEKEDRAFSFIPINPRDPKPRTQGITEIRGPYYSVLGKNALTDVLDNFGSAVDGLKFAGGSFALMPRARLRELIELAHEHSVYVSTGGWIERVLSYGLEYVDRYIGEARDLGFDVIELSAGFISLPADDLLRLIEKVARAGLKPKPELGIQFGAGGGTPEAELKIEGTRDVKSLIRQGRRILESGWVGTSVGSLIMIESEGITENVTIKRSDVIAQIADELGIENVMFEAADPEIFEWYVKTFGANVNLFIDHSQVVQLEALRRGSWGTQSSWGRIVAFPEEKARGAQKKAG